MYRISPLNRNVRENLTDNIYPGRVIIIGMNNTEQLVIVYAITGRSESSQNRIFQVEGEDLVKTVAIDITKIKKPELELYNAYRKIQINKKTAFIVTNGSQTDDLADGLEAYGFKDTLLKLNHEPDFPNYTPRISGVIYARGEAEPQFSLCVIKSKQSNPEKDSLHDFYENLNVRPGTGYCIHTYTGNGDPLPSFRGKPFKVPLIGNASDIAHRYWVTLDPKFRVSLFTKVIDLKTLKSNITILKRGDD